MRSLMDLINREKLVIISRGYEGDTLLDAARALLDAGIRLLEATFDHALGEAAVADNKAKLERLRRELGEKMAFGAGTVLNIPEVRAAFEAGASFIVSPNTNEDVIKETKRLGMLSIPGAMTPTEICRAFDMGADMVKLFPADDLGMHYIQNLRGPLPHIPLMATGGVNPDNIPQLLNLGVAAVGTGVTVLRRDLMEKRDFEGIAALARAHVEAVRGAEEKKA